MSGRVWDKKVRQKIKETVERHGEEVMKQDPTPRPGGTDYPAIHKALTRAEKLKKMLEED